MIISFGQVIVAPLSQKIGRHDEVAHIVCTERTDGFLLPKPPTKLKPTFVETEADSNWQWFNVQKRLLSTTRPEKLWRYYNT